MVEKSLFWADQIADEIIKRVGKGKGNVKCQQTPSGGKHIGNLNDVARAFFPYKSALERGCKIDFVHTTDDRDPLKDVPKRLPDLEGNWKESTELMDMSPYLGMPLFLIPDPFKCCASWSQHFTEVWMRGVNELGMRPKLYSVNELYKSGKLEPYIEMVFRKQKEVGKIISKFQETKGENYIPFDAICPKCRKLANIDSFDLRTKKVHFTCGGKAIKKKKAEGCGFEGEVNWAEGKLQWRFEWPALWGVFQTTYEPFGKDHAEGSWKSGKEIAKKIYGFEPPIPFVYEFFLVNGDKMSASRGNVYIVQDMLKIIEPEVFLYFYTKRPGKQRDLDLKNIHHLVEDFERVERVYFDVDTEENKKEKENLKRSYSMSVGKIPKKLPLRVSYQFASMVSQYYNDPKKIIELLQKLKFLKEKPKKAEEEAIIKRFKLASNWMRLYAPDEIKLVLQETISDSIRSSLTENQKKAVHDLSSELNKKQLKEEDLYNLFWHIAARNQLKAPEFFKACYMVLIARERGPKLAPFIITIGQKRASEILGKI